jgi:hypothetical protein
VAGAVRAVFLARYTLISNRLMSGRSRRSCAHRRCGGRWTGKHASSLPNVTRRAREKRLHLGEVERPRVAAGTLRGLEVAVEEIARCRRAGPRRRSSGDLGNWPCTRCAPGPSAPPGFAPAHSPAAPKPGRLLTVLERAAALIHEVPEHATDSLRFFGSVTRFGVRRHTLTHLASASQAVSRLSSLSWQTCLARKIW